MQCTLKLKSAIFAWYDKKFLDLIHVIYCNISIRTKVDVTYLFRLHFPVKMILLVILPKKKTVILNDIIHTVNDPQRHSDWKQHSPQTLDSFVSCRSTTHIKLIIPQMTAIADFEQRWQQRGKNMQIILCSQFVNVNKISIAWLHVISFRFASLLLHRSGCSLFFFCSHSEVQTKSFAFHNGWISCVTGDCRFNLSGSAIILIILIISSSEKG